MSPNGRQIKGDRIMDNTAYPDNGHFNDFWFRNTYVDILESLCDNSVGCFMGHALSMNMQTMLDNEVHYAKREESFGVYLQKLVDKHNMSDPQVYKQANISRQQFSEIKKGFKNGRRYYPNKIDIFRIAIVLKLSLKELNKLLERANCSLLRNDICDAIITFFIDKEIYDFCDIDEQLIKYKQPPLSKIVDNL